MTHEVTAGSVTIGGSHPHILIAGPCVMESESLVLETAHRIANITRALGIPFVFKSSFDKANRTSIHSFRGPGVEKGMRILDRIKREVGVPVLTDIHSIEQVAPVA